jgi:hypothetical protein
MGDLTGEREVPRQGSRMGTAVTSELLAGSLTVERSVSLRDVNRLADGVG